MSTVGYYPGCSLSGTAAEYDRSLKAVARKLDVELREVPEWVCCGASSAHAVDHAAALCLAADTLAKAKKAGLDQVMAPCAMCYQRLATAAHDMNHEPQMPRRLAEALGESPDLALERVKVLSLLNWLEAMPEDQLKSRIARPLNGLKVACYYGCLLLRPPKVTGADNTESPRSMERLAAAAGAQAVRWSMAHECCGGSFALSRKSVVLRQGRKIVDAARLAGADVMVLACPMCHNNLDMRQGEFDGDGKPMPMLYLTQLLGLAMGIDEQELGFAGHFVPVMSSVGEALARK